MRITVQLCRCDFQPSDVLVVAYGSKLRVVARQEVTSSSAGAMTSRREFSRELDVTRPVIRSTLRAVLQPDTGLLSVAAVIMTPSSSSSSAAAAAAAVASVLPTDAVPCCVQLRWGTWAHAVVNAVTMRWTILLFFRLKFWLTTTLIWKKAAEDSWSLVAN